MTSWMYLWIHGVIYRSRRVFQRNLPHYGFDDCGNASLVWRYSFIGMHWQAGPMCHCSQAERAECGLLSVLIAVTELVNNWKFIKCLKLNNCQTKCLSYERRRQALMFCLMHRSGWLSLVSWWLWPNDEGLSFHRIEWKLVCRRPAWDPTYSWLKLFDNYCYNMRWGVNWWTPEHRVSIDGDADRWVEE